MKRTPAASEQYCECPDNSAQAFQGLLATITHALGLGCSRCEARGSGMLAIWLEIAEIAERIAAVRENLRGLVEQAAAYSGAADEELTSRRIAEQEAELKRLTKQRDELRRSVHSFVGQGGGETK